MAQVAELTAQVSTKDATIAELQEQVPTGGISPLGSVFFVIFLFLLFYFSFLTPPPPPPPPQLRAATRSTQMLEEAAKQPEEFASFPANTVPGQAPAATTPPLNPVTFSRRFA